jgi:hypothetical protein
MSKQVSYGEMRDPVDLKPHPQNPKQHTKSQIDGIVASIRRSGFAPPISITPENRILAGHGRWRAAKQMGLTEVPVTVMHGMTEAEQLGYVIADNELTAMTGNDDEVLAANLQEIREQGVDVTSLGIGSQRLEDLLGQSAKDPLEDRLGDAPDDVTGVRQLGAMVLEGEDYVMPWGWPRLRQDMRGTLDPIIAAGGLIWIGGHRTEALPAKRADPGYLYLYGSDSTQGMPTDTTTMAFYVDDKRFERVWNNLGATTAKFLNAEIPQIVAPNYTESVLDGLAVQLYQFYRCFFVSRYMQEAGIRVIPDLRYLLDPEMQAETFGTGGDFSVQIQTFTTEEEADEMRSMLGEAIEATKPDRLMVYAGPPGLVLGEEIGKRHNVEVVLVPNRSVSMRQDMAKRKDGLR